MAFDGSGTFNRPVSDYVFDTTISETDMNTEMDGLATGLSSVVHKDGQTTITANLPMANFRHTGVGNAGARNDYAAAGQIQDGALRYGGVAGGTANALTVTLSPALAAYVIGQKIRFISSASANTGATTINVNALGVKAIEISGSALSPGDIQASKPYEVMYDGTAFQLFSHTVAVPLTRGHLDGLILSNDTDTDHDINVTVGWARDSADGVNLNLASEITKQIDATWASGDDAGGLSSSLTAPANDTWYHVHLILVGGAVDVGFDTSVTAANLITDHSATAYRRVGAIRTDGSANVLGFFNFGNTFMWTTRNPSGSEDLDTSTPSTTQANVVLTVPTGLVVEAIFNAALSLGGAAFSIFSRSADTIPVPGATNYDLVAATGATVTASEFRRFTDTSAQIAYRSSSGVADLNIRALGWVDDRAV